MFSTQNGEKKPELSRQNVTNLDQSRKTKTEGPEFDEPFRMRRFDKRTQEWTLKHGGINE